MRYILYPFSIIYSLVIKIRNWLYDINILKEKNFTIPIICVGNLAVGGTGKTPQVDYLINFLKKEYKTVLLSRGYKRKKSGFLYVNKNDCAKNYGDEPYLIKEKHPEIIVAVNNNREKGIQKILFDYPKTEVIILDDGFQHRKINAGLNILLTEYDYPFFSDFMLPFGTLRDNKKSYKRADIIIATKCPTIINRRKFTEKINLQINQEIYFSNIKYNSWYCAFGKNKIKDFNKYNILLVTGIAKTYQFIKYLKSNIIYKHLKFSDHHTYSENDIKLIIDTYCSILDENKLILTTEKDFVKLKSFSRLFKLINLYVCPIEININESSKFDNKITNYVKTNQRNR